MVFQSATSLYTPPDYERHVFRNYPLHYLYPYINMQSLIGYHLGLRGKVEELLEEQDAKAVELKELVDGLFNESRDQGLITANGMYRFFPAQSLNDDVIVYDPDDHTKVLQKFTFPRQKEQPQLCVADYFKSVDSGVMDSIVFFVVTAGEGIREIAEEWKIKGDYLRCHTIQAIAIEVAAAFVERIHQMIRDSWGFPDPVSMTMQERLYAKYQGQRFSFGYPACPNLENQKLIFNLMKPEDIGIHLTEGFMMDPEASVAGFAVAHPSARYFAV